MKGKQDRAACLVSTVFAYVTAHPDQNDFVQELAVRFHVSEYYLMHTFKKYTGTTLVGYRNTQRLNKAKRLLRGSRKTVTHIALECGYNNSSYFAELFKKEVGMTPTQYRRLPEIQS